MTATISGIAAIGTLTQDANTPFASGLTLHTFTFTPTASGTATLSFSPGTTPTYQNQYGAQLDNVSVIESPVTTTTTTTTTAGTSTSSTTTTTTTTTAAPVIQNGSFETATIGIWGQGWVDVGGPGQGTCLISDWGNGAASVANWTFSTSLNGGGLWGNSFMGTYLRQGNDPTAIINDYSAYVAPTPFGTRQWNLLYGSTISQSFPVTVNNQYEVKYYQCNTAQAAAGTKLTATISGIAAIGTLTQDANTAFADGLTLHTFTFEPTASGTALLSFSPGTTPVYQTLYGAQLDNVSVTETPVTTTTTTTTTAGTSTSSTTTTTTTTTAPPIIQNGSFETATISLWGNGFVGGPAQGTCLISDWGNGAASVANWTFSTSLNGGGLWGSSYMGMYLRQGNDPTVTVDDYSAHVAPTPFGTRQWNLLYGSTVSQSFAVTAGIPYEVKYYQCNTAYAAAGVKLTATISGVPAAGTLTQEADTPFASGLTLHTFVFTPAASGTATLSFSPGTTPTYQNQYGAQLDNVSVKAFPPTGALMILR